MKYYSLTGRPLGVTGEIGEYEAVRLLNLKYAPVREAGFDAKDRSGRKYQIKTRVCDPKGMRGRLGSIKVKHPWDFVVLILLDRTYKPVAIYRADRTSISKALKKRGSKARNERGSLAISKFKSIGRQLWPKG